VREGKCAGLPRAQHKKTRGLTSGLRHDKQAQAYPGRLKAAGTRHLELRLFVNYALSDGTTVSKICNVRIFLEANRINFKSPQEEPRI
jgi:hypothetical protein